MRVLQYYPFGYCYPVGSGADRNASNQLDYFKSRNWTVDCVFADLPHARARAPAFRERYEWVNSVTLLPIPWGPHINFREQLLIYERAAKWPQMRDLFARRHDLFFTNYVFTAPLATAAPPECLRVLETHDLMSRSFAVSELNAVADTGRRSAIEAGIQFHFRVEMELYSVFDRVLMVSAAEHEIASQWLPDRVFFVPQTMPLPVDEEAATDVSPHDLLFVGSNHIPNRIGLEWFYRHVYLPHLRRHGVSLLVVGSVCTELSFNDDCRVTRIPSVEGSLAPVYKQAKVVIVPLFEGTGMSIKMIESLGQGGVTVTTPVGARGLEPDPAAFLQLDMRRDPKATADKIRTLLQSRTRRAAMSQAARAYFASHFSLERYHATLNRLLVPAAAQAA